MKNRLKIYRAVQNITQEELARKVQVTRQTIISIEAGRYDPSLELAFKLAKIFNTTIEDLFIYEEKCILDKLQKTGSKEALPPF